MVGCFMIFFVIYIASVVGWGPAILFFIFMFIIGMMGMGEDTETMDTAKKTIKEKFITDNDLNIDISIPYRGNKANIEFCIDTNKEYVIIFSNYINGKHILDEIVTKSVKYSDIISCEIRENDVVSGSIERAVVGGVLAGETGAMIGAMTTKTSVNSYKIVIIHDDIVNPQIILEFIENKNSIKKDSNQYKDISKYGEEVFSKIKVILNSQK